MLATVSVIAFVEMVRHSVHRPVTYPHTELEKAYETGHERFLAAFTSGTVLASTIIMEM